MLSAPPREFLNAITTCQIATTLKTEPTMPHIQWIEDEAATGLAAEVYAVWKRNNPGRDRMPGILKCFSQRPDFLQQVIDFGNTVHFSEGHLTRRTKEMIATYVSGLNQCPY